MKQPQKILDRIPEHWGRYLSIPDEWIPIVDALDDQLAALCPTYEVHQVKEKFWGLRYYIDESNFRPEDRDKVHTLIREAEQAVYGLDSPPESVV